MLRFPVTSQKQQELQERMAACGLRETDIEEQFITAGGPGGQKTNHTATAVRIRHIPTGIEVKWSTERSQGLNRFFARRRLCELLEAMRFGREAPVAREADRIRRQKKRRTRRFHGKHGSAAETSQQDARGRSNQVPEHVSDQEEISP